MTMESLMTGWLSLPQPPMSHRAHLAMMLIFQFTFSRIQSRVAAPLSLSLSFPTTHSSTCIVRSGDRSSFYLPRSEGENERTNYISSAQPRGRSFHFEAAT